MASPTSRSLAEMRKRGYLAQVVEKTIPTTYIKKDLFGGIDIVAISGVQKDTVGIQSTSYSNHSARRKKCNAEPMLDEWKKAGNRLVIHSWHKVKNRWQLREEEI
jgi:hypothetical protein